MTEEMEEAREERELSLIMDSGLDLEESELLTDGRRVRYLSRPIGGKSSFAHLLKLARCTFAIAEEMDGRREPHALAAGVDEAVVEGVSWGVGKGPMRASAGVGGAMLGLGSKKRGGQMFAGVGVVS